MPITDCESISAGFLGQPVNTLTTLAFVVAGVVVAFKDPRIRWLGAGLVANGVGSFLFHGPMPSGSQWAHDVTLAWLILLVAGAGRSWERWTRLPGLAAVGVVFALLPVAADPVAIALVVVAGVSQLARDRSRTARALALIGGFAILGRLGSTGGPLCDPESLLQPHGVWHIGAAVVVAWWAVGLTPDNAVRGPVVR